MKSKALNILKIAISLGLIAYVFSKVHVESVAISLQHANSWLVLLALVCYLMAITVNGFKWLILLRAQQVNVPFRAVLRYMFVGFFFNNVLPANIGGDVMRGYGMARYTDRTAQAAVSVVLDRFIGLIAYMIVAAIMAIILVVFLGQENLEWLLVVAIISLAAIAAALGLMLSRRLRALLGKTFRWRLLAPLAPIYESTSDAFEAYRYQYGAIARAFGIAFVGLMLTNLVNWLLFEATGGGVSMLYVLLFNPLIALVLLLPISVGGHGVIQGAYPFFYSMVGVSNTQAVAVSVLMSFIIIVGSLPGGVLWLRMRKAPDPENASPAQASQPST